jgi:uncharacterized membrane protein
VATLVATLAFPAAADAAEPKVIKVLITAGDWKAQAWYQEVWMANGGPPKRFRGQFIQQQVEAVAPGRFAFTFVPNSIAQEYFDADYLSQFDVVLIGDLMVHLSDQFQTGVRDFVKNGGGLIYCANHKYPIGAKVRGQAFESVLPTVWPKPDANGEWPESLGGGKAEVAAADHPVIKGLDWANAPGFGNVFNMPAKPEATVLLKRNDGKPMLTAWECGKGRAIFSAAIFANDEQSEAFANWKDFGKYYAQVFTWLGEKSTRTEVALKDATAKVAATVDCTKPVNPFSTGLFSIHGTEGIEGHAREVFDALNLKGAFHRFDINPEQEQGKFDFGGVDNGINEARKSGLQPLLLLSPFSYGQPKWLWTERGWGETTAKEAGLIAEMVAATLAHTNHGKPGDAGYEPVVKYIEICNEPDINARTIGGYVTMIKAVGERVHRDFPGVKVGAYCPYHEQYIHSFIDQCGGSYDWLSFHPYGWSPEVLFAFLEGIADYAKQKGHPTEILITEWDFWIQGRQKFDYMMLRYFEAVKHPNVISGIHYRLWQYSEPIYMFGVLWEGYGPAGVAGKKGDPMHDAYDAFWLWRDFRGERVKAEVTLADPAVTAKLLQHVSVAGSTLNGKSSAVLYYGWAYGGDGFKDFVKGVNYAKIAVDLKLVLPPSDKERKLTVSRATGEGFEIVKQGVKVAAGQKEVSETIEVAPLTGYAVTVE